MYDMLIPFREFYLIIHSILFIFLKIIKVNCKDILNEMIFGVRHGERADFISKKSPEYKAI